MYLLRNRRTRSRKKVHCSQATSRLSQSDHDEGMSGGTKEGKKEKNKLLFHRAFSLVVLRPHKLALDCGAYFARCSCHTNSWSNFPNDKARFSNKRDLQFRTSVWGFCLVLLVINVGRCERMVSTVACHCDRNAVCSTRRKGADFFAASSKCSGCCGAKQAVPEGKCNRWCPNCHPSDIVDDRHCVSPRTIGSRHILHGPPVAASYGGPNLTDGATRNSGV